ncbi:helix-turn-helix domain-containing protein [Asticcacaulis benevestitus]|uniref:HTH cro/C1-type domain-containing protein n=1 Tax=Asticcacaulis benevestitus DSM 16100 = ATCC BAA-896 TaxID=1121022 RepID=V4Q490_9CAUL|nr:helix-turn-helix transcriptional regulator [Asticcacaulis benevestitus]ESQ92620.1 hypothetical protein ABENE_07320 [Asticcacaulis benevestitus DSM 16100 = ATCC BAA-896]
MPIPDTASYRIIITSLVCARKKIGMTQTELAQIWGKTQSAITKIENMDRRLDVQDFLDICLILSINPSDIIKDAHNELKRQAVKKSNL